MERLGIGNHTIVVAYDDMVLPLSAARLWWALSYYGHADVRVLDGGLRRWRAEGRPLSTAIPAPPPATFTPRPQPDWLATKAAVVAALDQPDVAIVDCLAADQYHGAEGTVGDRPGHIPAQSTSPTWQTPTPLWRRHPPPNATAYWQPSGCCRICQRTTWRRSMLLRASPRIVK